jgi:hypothetical protein
VQSCPPDVVSSVKAGSSLFIFEQMLNRGTVMLSDCLEEQCGWVDVSLLTPLAFINGVETPSQTLSAGVLVNELDLSTNIRFIFFLLKFFFILVDGFGAVL